MDFILQHFLLSLEIQYVLAFDFLNDTHIVSMPYGTNHIFLLLNKICMNKKGMVFYLLSKLDSLHSEIPYSDKDLPQVGSYEH